MLRTPKGQKLFRYSMASVVAVVVSMICLVIFVGRAIGWRGGVEHPGHRHRHRPHLRDEPEVGVGQERPQPLLKEVVPFWALAFIGWAFSTMSVKLMEDYAKHTTSATPSHLVGDVAYVGAFGVLWVAKFVIFNKLLFVHHHPVDEERVLDRAA